MYGTVARLKVKPGQMEAMKKHMSAVSSKSSPGFVSVNVYQMDANSNELLVSIAFKNKETYVANANRPETNSEFEKMVQLLSAEPEWHDGEIIYSS